MFTPNFNQDQYLDADSFNTAANSVSGSIASGLAATFFPGLVSSNSASYNSSGLIVSAQLPAPFGVIFGTGVLSNAHGTITGADTQTYVASFSGLAPVSGAPVTAYLVAGYQQIQQTAIAITGPPPGHPDYNPNFVPYTGYQTNVDSLAVSATVTPADNLTTFELFRTTLTSGITALGTLSTAFQRRRAPRAIFGLQTPVVTGVLSVESTNYLSVSGTYTLPAAAISNTQLLSAVSTVSGTCTIAASGADLIYGFGSAPASGVASLALTDGNAVTLGAINGVWQILQGTAGAIGGSITNIFGGNPIGAISGGYLAVTSATNLQFTRTIGLSVPINGVFQPIPIAGITISNAGLIASTLYYVYVFMAGPTMTLELSVTGHAIGPDGYQTKIGDSSRTLLGMVYTSANTPGQFVLLDQQHILCVNYYNQLPIVAYSASTGTAGSTLQELDVTKRLYLLAWPNEAIFIFMTGEQVNNTANQGGSVVVFLDGGQWTAVSGGGASATALNIPTSAFGNLPMTEGYHYVQTVGVTTAGTSTFNIASTLTAFG